MIKDGLSIKQQLSYNTAESSDIDWFAPRSGISSYKDVCQDIVQTLNLFNEAGHSLAW